MAVLNFDIKTVALPSGEDAKAVFLTGSIDASTNQTFEGRLTDILSGGTRHVLLVLTNVKYINSTGLGTIVKCVDQFREKGGDIKLVGVPTKVIALFEMLGLLQLFETHDTIEAAVASVGAAKPAAPAAPTVKFPLQFKHPATGMGLNVAQPGRYRDPRSGDYFSVDANGTIEFYEMSKVKVVEARLPCDLDFTSALAGMAANLAERVKLPAAVSTAAARAITEIGSAISRQASDSDTLQVLIVADPERIQIGLISSGNGLAFAATDPVLATLKSVCDEVKHQALPKGHLLSLSKKA